MYHHDRVPPHSRIFAMLLSCAVLCWLSLLSGCNGGGGGTATTSTSVSGEAATTNPSVSDGTTLVEPSPTNETDSAGPDIDPFDQTYLLTGVAAIGQPLDGYVYIQDATGVTVNVPIATDGTYQADIEGMQSPFIVRAQAGDDSVWYSFAPTFDTLVRANISQLTTLAMFLANGKTDLAALYDAWPQRHATFSFDAMLHAQGVVNLNFGELFQANGLDHTIYNFFTTMFTADGTGFDAVLDAIGPISFGAGTYRFQNPVYQAAFDENVAIYSGFYCPPPEPVTCPEGASCTTFTQVGCITRWVLDTGSTDGNGSYILDGYIPPTEDINNELIPPDTYEGEPLQDNDEGLDDPEAITSEAVVQLAPRIE